MEHPEFKPNQLVYFKMNNGIILGAIHYCSYDNILKVWHYHVQGWTKTFSEDEVTEYNEDWTLP